MLRASCQRSLVLGGAGGGGAVHSPNHFSISFGGVLQIKAAKEEETISILAKKLLIFHLGKVPVKKVHSSLFDFQSLIALQIPHLWPPAVQILLKEVKLAEDYIPPATILLYDHLPLKNNVE